VQGKFPSLTGNGHVISPKRADSLAIYKDSIEPIIKAGQAEFIDVEFERLEGVNFLSSAGHSLAHLSISINSKGEEVLFAGDVIHHPTQIFRPEWNSSFCEFPELARESRIKTLEYAAKKYVLFCCIFSEELCGADH
jgi:glyoxylase-like metal-dependent hydrolase (beta-lactamase superfamily II)